MFKSLFLYILCALLLTWSGCGQRPTQSTPVATKSPLFVVTGFGSDIRDVSLTDLTAQWKSGQLLVLKSCFEEAMRFFDTPGGQTVDRVEDFIPVSHNQLLLCDLQHLTPRLPAISVNSIQYFKNHSSYPLYVQSDQPGLDSLGFTWLSITGVTALSRGSGLVADQKGVDFLVDGIKDQFSQTDYLHISNEVSFTPDCQYVGKTMQFCTKCRDFEVFRTLGVDIVELTGNHNRDYGKQPFIDTYEWYKKNSFLTFGGGRTPAEAAKPLVITICGTYKLAFIGFNELCPCGECADEPGEPGANRWNKEKASELIDSLRLAGVQYIIASVQFGEVDSYEPTSAQTSISHYLIDRGADMVYGSQAHQIQQFEFYKGKPILHGLGNFLFDQIHRVGVRQSCFVHCIFYQGKLIQLYPVFTMMGLDRQLKPATPDEENAMRQEVFKKELLYR